MSEEGFMTSLHPPGRIGGGARSASAACLLAFLALAYSPAYANEAGSDPGTGTVPGPSAKDASPPGGRNEASRPAKGIVLVKDFEGMSVRLTGYFQLWASVMEQTENGLKQPLSGDEAAQEASGFCFRRVRLDALFEMKDQGLKARFGLRLEGSPGLLDAWISWCPFGEELEIRAGQMKIPSTYEVETPSEELDFAERSRFSNLAADWALSRGPSMSSPFPGARSYMRDLGLSVRGKVPGGKYFLMVGNGLGANLYIGGSEYKQFLFANSVGAYFAGLRLSLDPLPLLKLPEGFPVKSITAGMHACWNRHPEVILNDERTVTDLSRRSWSIDASVDLFGLVKVAAMTGAGYVEDDFDNNRKTDYAYRGWEIKAVVTVAPELLDFCVRYDSYWDERNESGDDEFRDAYTFGLSFTPSKHIRIQAEFKLKILYSDTSPETDDNIFLLAAQFSF